MAADVTPFLILVLGGYFAVLVWTNRDNEVVHETTLAELVANLVQAGLDLQRAACAALVPVMLKVAEASARFEEMRRAAASAHDDETRLLSRGYQINNRGGLTPRAPWPDTEEGRAACIRWALAYLRRQR